MHVLSLMFYLQAVDTNTLYPTPPKEHKHWDSLSRALALSPSHPAFRIIRQSSNRIGR